MSLQIVTCISNPAGYKTRVDLYRRFQANMRRAKAPLTTVELTYGALPPQVKGGYGNHVHVALPEAHELWHKENLLNIGVANLPWDWDKVCFLDADVEFQNPNWLKDLDRKLEQVAVVQPFSHIQDLGPNHEPLNGIPAVTSFAYARWHGLPESPDKKYGTYWHPGMGLAFNRVVYEGLGGLIDWAIVGNADWHMLNALVGTVDVTVKRHLAPSYVEKLHAWQRRADHWVAGDLGYVDGLITHYFHGAKSKRSYTDRWKILHDWQYNPNTDIFHDWSNHRILKWSHMGDARMRGLRDDLRRYFRSRREDDLSTE